MPVMVSVLRALFHRTGSGTYRQPLTGSVWAVLAGAGGQQGKYRNRKCLIVKGEAGPFACSSCLPGSRPFVAGRAKGAYALYPFMKDCRQSLGRLIRPFPSHFFREFRKRLVFLYLSREGISVNLRALSRSMTHGA